MKNILTISLLLLFFSCSTINDGPYKDCPKHYFSDYYKSYTMFNVGSYWIYKDTIYNVTDTVILVAQQIYFVDECDFSMVPQEFLEQEFSSSFFNNNTEPHHIRGFADLGFYNDALSLPMGYFIDNTDITGQSNYLDSILVNSKWYKDIRYFEEYYWSKGIGLIKKELKRNWNSDTTYNFDLVKYNLE